MDTKNRQSAVKCGWHDRYLDFVTIGGKEYFVCPECAQLKIQLKVSDTQHGASPKKTPFKPKTVTSAEVDLDSDGVDLTEEFLTGSNDA